jgi:4Fe-4S ferredoxin
MSRRAGRQSVAKCQPEAGKVVPVIDRTRCEGKQDCVAVCPFDVFEMRHLTQEDTQSMGFFPRIKARLRGNWQAFVIRPEACHACNLCVLACPEQAIKLIQSRDIKNE